MTNSEKHSFLPIALKAFFRRSAIRFFGLLFVCAGLLLAVALATYNPADPSFNTATGEPATNLIGTVGAIWADLLWQYSGLGALLFPIALVAWGILIIRLKWHKFQTLRIFCFIPTLLLLLVLFSALPEVSFPPVQAGFGGAVMPTFYLPLRHLLTAAHLSYLEYVILPIVFIVSVFGMAATLGIPFYLVKRWIAGTARLLQRLILFFWNKIKNTSAPKEEEEAELSIGIDSIYDSW